MTERLIIRLASKASQKNHWLIWSDSENEIIGSGEVNNAEELNLLTEKAQQRAVICLLPSVDLCIKKVAINGAFNRQMQQALPYLMEEELASDVEQLHFTVIAKQTDLVHVAICERVKIVTWQAWLQSAQIECKQFIPEGLALPVVDDSWSALLFEQQWLVREDEQQAWSCELSMLDLLLASKLDSDSSQQILSYTELPESSIGEWVKGEPVLPMELLARGTQSNKVNILSGQFAPKKESSKLLKTWQLPLLLSYILVVVVLVNIYLENHQVKNQTLLVKQQVEAIYKHVFPTQKALKYARIKKSLKNKLKGAQGEERTGFLVMLNELVPAFSDNPQLQASSIKFDASKQEMRVLAVADDFAAFEKFNRSVAKQYRVEQGALNSSKGKVSGLLTIRKR